MRQPELPPHSTIFRLARYILVRAILIYATVIASVFVVVVLANLGGRVDAIVRDRISQAFLGRPMTPEMLALSKEERIARLNEELAQAEEAAGLNEPFLWRCLRFVGPALTLDLGESTGTLHGERGVFPVQALILDRIPATLLLLGVTDLIVFVSSVYVALYLSERHSRFLDKLIALFSPTSAVPAWFYGIFLLALFAGTLPSSGVFEFAMPDSWSLRTLGAYVLGTARHMALPCTAILLSTFFQSVYMWRSLFLVYADEDYVELARAKGLPPTDFRRRYILRPTLPAVLTNSALMFVGIWSGSVVLEVIFNWPGMGQLFYQTLHSLNSAVTVGLAAMYASFLGITLLLLDIAYALVDPRVRVGDQQENRRARAAGAPERGLRWRWRAGRQGAGRREGRRMRPMRPDISRSVRSLLGWPSSVQQCLAGLGHTFRELLHYPSAIVGLLIIGLLAATIPYTVATIPYEEAIRHWHGTVELEDLPQNARPVWFNLFSRTKLPPTVFLDSREGQADKQVGEYESGKEMLLTYTFDYTWDAFPEAPLIHFETEFEERAPLVALTWLTPDGREVRLSQFSPKREETYRLGQDARLGRLLGGQPPEEALFGDPERGGTAVLKGTYRLQIHAYFFEGQVGDLDGRFVMRGQVYGLAGTDYRRRDLMVGLLWGTPTVLAFGLLGAAVTVVGAMVIAATGAWFGGVVDGIIQRLTEMNMAVPLVPLLALATFYFTLRIWTILAAAIVLSIFGSRIKTYRAVFLQARSAPYVEAALSYGASNARIIRSYLIPRVAPLLLPQIVTVVPAYVFLEAALAFLGSSDPVLPTWGKIIADAYVNHALLNGQYYWILQPALLLLLLGFAFAMVGTGLERILNPRLQDNH